MAREVNVFPGFLAISTFVNYLFIGPFANWVNLMLIFLLLVLWGLFYYILEIIMCLM